MIKVKELTKKLYNNKMFVNIKNTMMSTVVKVKKKVEPKKESK